MITLGERLLQGIVCSNAAYKAIGMVRQGLSFGLLGVAADGHYARVNGAYVEKLEADLVKQSLSRIRPTPTPKPMCRTASVVGGAVQVTVRKKRVCSY
jgi:hypothetical protein